MPRLQLLAVVALAATVGGLTLAPTITASAETIDGVTLLDRLPVVADSSAAYNRDYFQHWTDADGDGCDTRAEVLVSESLANPTYSSGCTVSGGQWFSPYDEATWTTAGDVDIDHLVPLAEAWRSGADGWTTELRRAFANDLNYEATLIAVTDNVNQSKGDRDPAQWMPPAVGYHCTYVLDWMAVKYRWGLSVDPVEESALANVLSGDCGTSAVILPAVAVDVPPPSDVEWPLYKTAYAGTIYELVDNQTPTPLTFERWRDVYNFAAPLRTNTDYVRYPWSATVYAVTFWPGGEQAWQWDAINYGQWREAGFPNPRYAGWIKGSEYYQWGTGSELFVRGADGVKHKLSYAEWQASGFRAYDQRANIGFQRLTWSSNIAYMSDTSTGQGYPIDYGQWQQEGFPSPLAVQRFPGDQFYRDANSSTIWYAGPTMNRPISYSEWAAAGFPAPRVDGTPGGGGGVYYANCDAVRAAGAAPLYSWQPGYRSGLDRDGDGVACE